MTTRHAGPHISTPAFAGASGGYVASGVAGTGGSVGPMAETLAETARALNATAKGDALSALNEAIGAACAESEAPLAQARKMRDAAERMSGSVLAAEAAIGS